MSLNIDNMKIEFQIKALDFHIVYIVLYIVTIIRHYYSNNKILFELDSKYGAHQTNITKAQLM
jgi:hypothetical protein